MKVDSNVPIRQMLISKGAKAGIPVTGAFELTARCNLACKMCYVRMTQEQVEKIGRELTAKEWLQIAKEAKSEGLMFLLLTGGEPTLRADFVEIYEGLAKMGFSISINSNGTMFREEIKEIMHRYPPAQINITLYGLCRQDYMDLCGNPNAFDRVIETLDWIQKEGILLHLNTTITPVNVSRWKEFEAFARNRQLELRMTTYCFPPYRGGDNRDFVRLKAEEAGELIVKDILWQEGAESIREKAASLEQPLNSCKLDVGDPLKCIAAKSQFWMNWDGSMVPCGMLDVPKMYPLESGFVKAWEGLKDETAKIRLCAECTTCPDRQTCLNCAAVIYAETGSFYKKPEYMCRLNKAYREALEKYSN